MYNNDHVEMAYADIRGGPLAPNAYGRVMLKQLDYGVLITAQIFGLTAYNGSGDYSSFHGFHIHSEPSCEIGDINNPYLSSNGHYNPNNKRHPNHAGDLPPLLTISSGFAYLSFLTDRFKLKDVIGLPFIIHKGVDDFTSQPSGNSGKRLACGIIKTLV